MGLKSTLLLMISILIPPLIAYWFPIIKFICLEFLPSLCSLLLNYDYELLITPRNLFLLLNLIIITIFASLHLQKHTGAASHKKRRRHRDLQQAMQYGATPVEFREEYNYAGEDGGESMAYTEGEAANGEESSEASVMNSRGLEAIEEGSGQARFSGEEAAMESTAGDTENIHDDGSTGLALTDTVLTANLDPIIHNYGGRLPLINHDRPLPSSRFTNRRSNASFPVDNYHHNHHHHHQAKSSLLRTVSRRVKKGDSLDATWKAINDNISPSNHDHDHNHVIKSTKQDFKPRIRRREPSITHEELNAKVESFISKFNEQMRIQRQESLLTYTQMVERGAA